MKFFAVAWLVFATAAQAVPPMAFSPFMVQSQPSGGDPDANKLIFSDGYDETIDNPTGSYTRQQAFQHVKAHSCPNLTGLNMQDSFLTTCDFSNCTALVDFNLVNVPATSLDLSGVALIISNLQVEATANLTSLNTSNVYSSTGDIIINGNSVLSLFSLPMATNLNNLIVHGEAMTGLYLPALTNFDGYFRPHDSFIGSLSLPNLVRIGADCSAQSVAATSFSAPNLVYVGSDLNLFGNASLSNVTISSLTTVVGKLDVNSCGSLTALDISSLAAAGIGTDFVAQDTPLVTITMPANWPLNNGQIFNASGCALNQSTVNDIIDKAFAASLTAGSIDLSGGTSSAPSAPQAAKAATLTSNGCTVTTN